MDGSMMRYFLVTGPVMHSHIKCKFFCKLRDHFASFRCHYEYDPLQGIL